MARVWLGGGQPTGKGGQMVRRNRHSNPLLSHSVLELDFSLFSLLALWDNKNWPPSIKERQLGNCQNIMGLKGCKWSSLNAPDTETPLLPPFLVNSGTLLPVWRKGKCPKALYHQVAWPTLRRGQSSRKERGVAFRKAAAKIALSFLKLDPIRGWGILKNPRA